MDDCLKPFHSRRLELTLENDCVIWEYSIVVPQSLRTDLLEEFHGAHLGVVKMNALVRFYFWWLGLDRDIEEITRTRKGCLESADDPPKASLHVCKWPQGPNHRIHLDFCPLAVICIL